jgi:NAD(P)H-hydrate epimerase
MRALGVEAMRELDRRAVADHGLPVRALMEVAGAALARQAAAMAPPGRGVLFLCGGGHNGGDGMAAARHLAARGWAVEVLLWADPARLTDAPAANLGLLAVAGVPLHSRPGPEEVRRRLQGAGLVVDCLLGTGFRGPVRAPLDDVIKAVNACGRPVLAADVPSGLSGDLGPPPDGPCVRAAATVSFGAVKAALVAAPGREWAGEVIWEPLGIPAAAWQGLDALDVLGAPDVAALLPPRRGDGHKGTYGTVGAVVGAVGFAGAAALCAAGALRAGCGLCQVLCPEPVQPVVATKLTEATVLPLPADAAGGLAAEAAAAPALAAALEAVDALAVGPGLGRAPGVARVVRRLLADFQGPVVVDADGLNALDLPTLAAARGAVVITPHPGEAGRLLGCAAQEVQADRVGAVRRLAREGRCVAVLKGAGTLVADASGSVAICPTGNDGMATGGSGDLLTGVLAGLLAQGAPPLAAARAAVYVHGEAGDRAAARLGRRALVAGDVLAHLGDAFRAVAGPEA